MSDTKAIALCLAAWVGCMGLISYCSSPEPALAPIEQRLPIPIKLETGHGHCTGIPLGGGYALTVKHYSGPKLFEHPTLDIAIVEIGDFPELDVRPPVRLSPPLLGETLFCIGFPLGEPLTITSGLASAKSGFASVPVAPGNSGSPIYDSEGFLVGVLSQLSVDSPFGFPQLVHHLPGYVPIADCWDWVLEKISQG